MTRDGTSLSSRPDDAARRDTLFLTRLSRTAAAVFVAGLVVLAPFYLEGYGLARALLFVCARVVAGTGIAEVVVRIAGRSRRVGDILFLAALAWLAGLILVLSSSGDLPELLRSRSVLGTLLRGGEDELAWFYSAGGGLSGAGADLFWNGGLSTPAEAR